MHKTNLTNKASMLMGTMSQMITIKTLELSAFQVYYESKKSGMIKSVMLWFYLFKDKKDFITSS